MKVLPIKARNLILAGEAPDGLQVKGGLSLYECTSLKSLPQGLKVEGYLDLEGCTSLKSLPGGLKVERWLYLEGCPSLILDHWDVHVGGDVCWDEDVASRVHVEILPLMIAVEWWNENSKDIYRRILRGS